MEACNGCADIDGRPVDVERLEGITLIGVAECNGTLALEHYRCDRCRAIIARRFTGESDERVWSVIEAAH
ncbi:hypothetical protein R69746_08601 [Paraburkholderia aspalathi]|uniref:hypothetical protein n=1 Tax=Paraburkholderia aspalathi TaxID=1324617 RepID=UPI00190BD35E|nr:hypothetical protein [Paraburkholderia aspalathi]MBK3844497.1 hypothetical protein [Paraburkholderia aspalathi]CAE6873407.1 hypothetical protein R69746_08601 [Paraburkholderia aspalathi]